MVAKVNDECPNLSIVVIGRNEGERLVRCLNSVKAAGYPQDRLELIYVDTNSTDDSCTAAKKLGASVIRIQPERPSAAAARNAGLAAARNPLVQFLDGDTVLDPTWLQRAVAAIEDSQVACVFGRVEELAPTASIYNFWAHHDWYVPPGPANSCGGIAMFRRDLLVKVGGYDSSLIAGEERDLCLRLKALDDCTIMCLDGSMVRHDMNMTRFSQYWRRCRRTGHAYAENAYRHPELLQLKAICWRTMMHAAALLGAVALSVAWLSVWPLAIWAGLIVVAIMRNALRLQSRVGNFWSAVIYSTHHYLCKIPMALGQMSFWLRRVTGTRPQPLIEHRN